jgi:DNA-binding transcriptional regulator YiaG
VNQCQNHQINEIVLERYDVPTELMGIAGVSLHNAVVEERCTRCGHQKSILIPNLQGLIAAVAVERALMPLKMLGREIRFLREALEVTAVDLATTVEVLPTQVSRWENDAEPISPRSEKLLRLYVVDELAKYTAIKVNRNAIYRMKIRAWHSIEEKSEMNFWLSKKRAAAPRTQKREPKWRNTNTSVAA